MANITRHYRRAIDAAWAGRPVAFSPRDVQEMELSFSRGFSHGFLDGNNHKVLVRGDYAKKRGIFLGRVDVRHGRDGIRLDLAAPVKTGDGLVFDGDDAGGHPRAGRPGLRGRPPRPLARGRGRGPLGRARSSSGSAGTTSTSARSGPASGSGRPTTPS